MRFKTRIMLAVGCVAMLALSIPAFSRPSPRGLEPDQRATNLRGGPNKKNAQRAIKPNKPVQSAPQSASAPSQRPPVQQPSLMQRMSKSLLGRQDLVAEARKYMGTNPTSRSRLWCATFMNMVLAKVGYSGTNSDAAKSFAYYGRRVSEPRVGAIAVLTRGKRGGHVGVVSGIDAQGNPIIISGNHNKRVGEATYPRARVIAYVMPAESRPTTIQVAARSVANRAIASDAAIDSPIAELMAAIEAEQSRAESRPQPPRAPEPQVAQRVVQQVPQVPQVPHRAVQQMPEQAPQTARAGHRALPLDPALAELLGLKEPTQQPRPLPLRPQPRVQPQPGRVVAVR